MSVESYFYSKAANFIANPNGSPNDLSDGEHVTPTADSASTSLGIISGRDTDNFNLGSSRGDYTKKNIYEQTTKTEDILSTLKQLSGDVTSLEFLAAMDPLARGRLQQEHALAYRKMVNSGVNFFSNARHDSSENLRDNKDRRHKSVDSNIITVRPEQCANHNTGGASSSGNALSGRTNVDSPRSPERTKNTTSTIQVSTTKTRVNYTAGRTQVIDLSTFDPKMKRKVNKAKKLQQSVDDQNITSATQQAETTQQEHTIPHACKDVDRPKIILRKEENEKPVLVDTEYFSTINQDNVKSKNHHDVTKSKHNVLITPVTPEKERQTVSTQKEKKNQQTSTKIKLLNTTNSTATPLEQLHMFDQLMDIVICAISDCRCLRREGAYTNYTPTLPINIHPPTFQLHLLLPPFKLSQDPH